MDTNCEGNLNHSPNPIVFCPLLLFLVDIFFGDTKYFLHILVCVWFHATFDAFFQNPFFPSPCFSLKDPTAPLGLSNSTRSFSPDSMLPGSCPEPSCNKHTIRETNVTNLAPRALTTSQRKGLVM